MQERSGNYAELPPEILLYIFDFLDPASLCSVALVCSTWRPVSEDKRIWQRYFCYTFEKLEQNNDNAQPNRFLLDAQMEHPKAAYIACMRQEMKRYGRTPLWLREYVIQTSLKKANQAFTISASQVRVVTHSIRKVCAVGECSVGTKHAFTFFIQGLTIHSGKTSFLKVSVVMHSCTTQS